jgi:hypothetical protein
MAEDDALVVSKILATRQVVELTDAGRKLSLNDVGIIVRAQFIAQLSPGRCDKVLAEAIEGYESLVVDTVEGIYHVQCGQ